MLFAGPAGYDAGRSRNSFRGGAMTSAYLMPKYSLYLSNISSQFWWGMSCEISSRNVPVIFRPSALGTIRLPVGCRGSGGVPAANPGCGRRDDSRDGDSGCCSCGLFDESSSSNMNVCHNKIIY